MVSLGKEVNYRRVCSTQLLPPIHLLQKGILLT